MNSSKIDDVDGQHLIKYHIYMFSRIHTMKFQNELAKVSMKGTLKSILNNAYNEGLCYTTIIDVNKTTLYFVNTWVDEKASNKFHETNIDIVKQIKDMGVNLAIDGGKSETIYENDLLLDFFDKP